MNLTQPHRAVARMSGVAAVVTLLAISAVPWPVSAHDGHHLAIAVDDIKYKAGPPTLPPGAEVAVLLGDPAQEGPFVMRLRFPAAYEIPPHLHPKEEHVTVISGGFGMSTGKAMDRGTAPILPPGSFVRIPVGEAHFAWTEEETVVQINGMGPFGIEYVRSIDDPRND